MRGVSGGKQRKCWLRVVSAGFSNCLGEISNCLPATFPPDPKRDHLCAQSSGPLITVGK